MPELPEVETIVRQLAPSLPGSAIREVEVLHPGLLREDAKSFSANLRGATILEVTRRGKNIVLSLSPPQVLVVNLGMTGRILLPPRGEDPVPPGHLAVAFHLAPEGVLWYDDVRRFGHLLRFDEAAWEKESSRLGPEPLDPTLTPAAFHRALSASRTPVRSWLLDQTRLAGVGNIYANEALYRSRVHPARRAASLSSGEARALLTSLREVLKEAIRARGTTLRDYRTANGESGGFGPRLRIYGREGEPCPRCNLPIQRVVFANRSAFLCPRCQPEVTPSAPRSSSSSS
jgi:formamidopyrimidine-DNA glycosylase